MAGQTALWCGCGSERITSSGLCSSCSAAQSHSRRKFDGQREAVLRRDDRQCQLCGEREAEQIVVHHRRPGHTSMRWKVTLCRGCHAKVHRTKYPRWWMASELPAFWAL